MNKELSLLFDRKEAVLSRLDESVEQKKKEYDVLAGVSVELSAVKGELAQFLDIIAQKKKELATTETALNEMAEISAKQHLTIDTLNGVISEKEKALSIINDILDFRTRKKEVEDIKKMIV